VFFLFKACRLVGSRCSEQHAANNCVLIDRNLEGKEKKLNSGSGEKGTEGSISCDAGCEE
jgi:hypothetical protein